MLRALEQAYGRASERAANPNHAALMIERDLTAAGYGIERLAPIAKPSRQLVELLRRQREAAGRG